MNKTIKTVSATCACGVTFQREVKRGRPQVWCPPCSKKAYYERSSSSAVVEGKGVAKVLVAAEAATTPERIVNENDELDLVRSDIEAGMALLNAEYKTAMQDAIKKFGPFSPEVTAVSAVGLTAIQNLYAEWAPRKYKPGREAAEDVA